MEPRGFPPSGRPEDQPQPPWEAWPEDAPSESRPQAPWDAWPEEAPSHQAARPSGGRQATSYQAVASNASRHAQRRQGRVPGWTLATGVIAVAAIVAVVFFVGARGNGTTPPSASTPGAVQAATPSAGSATPQASAASAGAVTPPAVPAGLGSNWKQTFTAGFAGSQLDTSVWGTCFPWESQSGCANYGNSDESQVWYQPSQDQVSGGALHIVPEKAPTSGSAKDGSAKEYAYRSGQVNTFPGYKFQYGYIQIVARIPSANGLWTALWLAAANEEWPPEIDILEHWDNATKYYQYYHPAGAPRENTFENLGHLYDGYHTYGVYWSSSEVIWYIDGKQVFVTRRNVPHQPMYFIANVAVDEQVASLDPAKATLDIRSVDVWQQQKN